MVQLFRRQLAVLTATSLCIERVTTKLNLIHKVNMDKLYDECSTLKSILKRLKEDSEDDWRSKGVAARWVALFQVDDLPNMLCIISHILSQGGLRAQMESVQGF